MIIAWICRDGGKDARVATIGQYPDREDPMPEKAISLCTFVYLAKPSNATPDDAKERYQAILLGFCSSERLPLLLRSLWPPLWPDASQFLGLYEHLVSPKMCL